jgi:hypothetical protein
LDYYLKKEAARKQASNTALLAANFMLVSGLAHSSTLKVEEVCYSETSVDFSPDYTASYSRM